MNNAPSLFLTSPRSWAIVTVFGAVLGAGCATSQGQPLKPPAPQQPATQPTGSVNPAPEDTPAERLTAMIPELLSRHMVPGLTLCLIESGRISFSGAFGVRLVRDQAPMVEENVLEGGGLALPLLAHLALNLADEQLLDLNQPLGELLPGFAADDPGARTITTAMLLSQSSGLADGAADAAPLFETPPGSAFLPSLAGQRLLQRVLEQAGGAPLQELLAQRLFGPLGMDNTSMVWREEFNSSASAGHALPSRLPSTVRRKDRPQLADAPTSLHTSARDLALFVIATMGSGPGAIGSQRREAQLAPAIDIDPSRGLSHGLGWALEASADGISAYQFGASLHFRAFVLFDAEDQSGLIVLTNCVAGLELMSELVTAYDGRTHQLFKAPWPDAQG